MRFVFFRPNNVGEGILTGIASRLVWEKNVKIAVLRKSYFIAMRNASRDEATRRVRSLLHP